MQQCQNCTYIITSEDNVKIYHNDSLPFPELALMGQREQFDVVFCTVGIATASRAGFGARLTKPPLAVPYHSESMKSQTQFAELIKNKLPRTACLIPQQNKIYQVAKRK